MEEQQKKEWIKYFGIAIAALIGAFLAFYFIADVTIDRMMNPQFQAQRMQKRMMKDMSRMDNDFARGMMRENRAMGRMMKSFAQIEKTDDTYKIFINLKDVGGNPKDIVVTAKGNTITVEGAVEKQNHRGDKITKFTQNYIVDDKLDGKAITNSREDNDIVYTIPIIED